ncbi:hypothetical protein P3T76_007181 [Phytophthora citrophthora]|uniref:Crinkler (CRN) family protein n=1 Tax=Phytophthora citrophthora TaxID=4793 RepID=A0AAD9LLQ1_9STRA|nr:hypothetical protein P3T76_007181 [Phytophthora citrophthora]
MLDSYDKMNQVQQKQKIRLAAEEPKETFREGECKELPVLPFVDKYRLGKYYYTRACYAEYYKLVNEMLNDQERCVTVTGTPGVGKSIFYAYFFKRFRKEMQGKNTCVVAAAYIRDELVNVIAFEDDDDDGVWRINEEDIDDFIAGALGRGKNVVLLCDGPPKRIRGWIQTVVFTRPYKEWMRAVENDNCTLWLPLWELGELFESGEYIGLKKPDGSPIGDDTIEGGFDIFGGVARECFLPTEELVEQRKQELLAGVAQISTPEEFKRLARQGWTRDGLPYFPFRTSERWDVDHNGTRVYNMHMGRHYASST